MSMVLDNINLPSLLFTQFGSLIEQFNKNNNKKYIITLKKHDDKKIQNNLKKSNRWILIVSIHESILVSLAWLHLLIISSLQGRVQEFVRGGGENLKVFFVFSLFQGGGAAQKIADKMIFPTKKVSKYRWNSLKFALMTFFFRFNF